MRNALLLATASISLLLAGCSSGGTGSNTSSSSSSGGTASSTGGTTASSSSTSTSTSTGGQTGSALSIEPCFAQTVAPGITVQSLLTRDTLRLDMTKPNGFPNGRQLQDPVIDITLAYMFLDLTKHELDSLAKLAINPPTNADNPDANGNPLPFSTTFPFVLPPHGPAKAEGTGSGFAFRTNTSADYDTVDAMGNPAVGTILLQFNVQPPFNRDAPSDYVSNGGKYLNDLKSTLSVLGTALKDDFNRLSFTTCAR